MQKSLRHAGPGKGFTLVEVMFASFVLATALLSGLAALTQSFRLLDDARNKTLACQIIQSDIETTRLFSYSKLPPSGPITLPAEIVNMGQGFTAQRIISDVTACSDADGNVTMKQITVEVNWRDFRGAPHAHRYSTYYGKGGLSDYFVTNRPPI